MKGKPVAYTYLPRD